MTDTEQTPILIALSGDTLLEVTGPESLKFLQGQTSADFGKAGAMDVLTGTFCDVKGRVLTDFLALVVTPERVILRLAADLAEPMCAHLKKYLMFAKAEMAASPLSPLGCLGSHPAVNEDANNAERPKGVVIHGGFALPRRGDRLEIFAEANTAEDTVRDDAPWRLATIDAGEARVCAATSGKYLPQDLNYDLSGFINFQKGCYTGQEIIARLHWRGTPKRRLYLAAATSAVAPAPGVPLTTIEGGQALGSVVNAAATPDGELRLLIETTDNGLETGLVFEGTDTPLQQVRSLLPE